MGYTRIVQYGEVTEVYEYEKTINSNRKDGSVARSKALKRRKKLQSLGKAVYRSRASIRRSRTNFFRLCHHNIVNADSVHFLTLTFAYKCTYEEANRYQKQFFERLKKASGSVSLSYISVSELTKKEVYHFHILVFNLPTILAGERSKNAKYTSERETRNLQVLFERGYVDIRPTSYKSKGIAGYMAKYMAKSFEDGTNGTRRGYTCSRNINKFTTYGSNSLDTFFDLILPDGDSCTIEKREYPVPYLGSCIKTIINQHAKF